MRTQFRNDATLNQKVQQWWHNHPFNYFVNAEEGSWEFYRNIDRKFLKWIPFMQGGVIRF